MEIEARRARVRELWDQGHGQVHISKELAAGLPSIRADLDKLGVTAEERAARAKASSAKRWGDRPPKQKPTAKRRKTAKQRARAADPRSIAGAAPPAHPENGGHQPHPMVGSPPQPDLGAPTNLDLAQADPHAPRYDDVYEAGVAWLDSLDQPDDDAPPEVDDTPEEVLDMAGVAAGRRAAAPTLSAFSQITTLPDPLTVNIQRLGVGNTWDWVGAWNPCPRHVLTPAALPQALMELAGGGRYAVYVFTADDPQNPKTAITIQVPGTPRMPANVAAAENLANAQRAQAAANGAAVAPPPGYVQQPPPGGAPVYPPQPYQQPPPPYGYQQPYPQPYAQPYAQPYVQPYGGYPPYGYPPPPQPQVIVAPAPTPPPAAALAESPVIAELKRTIEDQRRAMEAQGAKNDESARLARESEMRREFADGLKESRTEMQRAIESQAAQMRDLITRISEKPAVDPAASMAPIVSVLTAAMAASGKQAESAAEAARAAGEASFKAVVDMSARQDNMLSKAQMQPDGLVNALKASGDMVGIFSKMAMSAIGHAMNAQNNNEPAWVGPVRDAVGQVGSLAQTLVAGAMGVPVPTEEEEPQPMLPAQPQHQIAAPQAQAVVDTSVTAPGAGVFGAPQAASVAGGAQTEYVARLRLGAPDLSAEQIAQAVLHVYEELRMWNAIYPPLDGLKEDPAGVLDALLGDITAFQDPLHRMRLTAAAGQIAAALAPAPPAQVQPAEAAAGSNGNGAAEEEGVEEEGGETSSGAAPPRDGERAPAENQKPAARKRGPKLQFDPVTSSSS